jgi:hypothetical protein
LNPHIDPRARIRNIINRALSGSTYQASHKDGDRILVLEARRANGKQVNVRFLGMKSSDTDTEPDRGAALKVVSVGEPDTSVLRVFMPRVLRVPSHAVRVRIEVGKAKLEIVCEDVEWWED